MYYGRLWRLERRRRTTATTSLEDFTLSSIVQRSSGNRNQRIFVSKQYERYELLNPFSANPGTKMSKLSAFLDITLLLHTLLPPPPLLHSDNFK